MSARIKAVALYKYIEEVEVISYSEEDINQYKSQCNQVFKQLKNLDLQFDEKQKIKTKYGPWYCKYDSQNIAYIILVTDDYQERHAYQFASKIQSNLASMGTNYGQQSQADIAFHIKKQLKEDFNEYSNNLANVDKIYAAQGKINDIKVEMNKGINEMMDNTNKLTNLEANTNKLHTQSKSFKKEAQNIESIMYWRNKKLQILITVVVICVLLLIAIPVITYVKDKW